MAKWSENRKTTRADGSVYDRGPSWPSITALTLAMAVTAIFFNNCSNEFRLKGASDEASLAGLSVCQAEQAKVFYGSIHPFTTGKCATCHVPSGPTGASSVPFGEGDKRQAFNAFLLPGFEKFKSYALNPGHVSGITGPVNQAPMDAAEAAWLAAENSVSCKGTGDSTEFATKLIDKPIGTPGATLNTAQVIQFNLDSESDRAGEFAAATFEISVYQITPVGGAVTYYITRPIVKTAASGMEVKGISVFINGQKYIEGTTFVGIDRYVPAATNNQFLSQATMLKQMPAGAAPTDTISVSFNHLRASDTPPPTPTPTPPAGAPNGTLLYANACQGCHGALANSTKRGRTAAQILNARATVPAMINNAAVQALSNAEIDAIAAALQ